MVSGWTNRSPPEYYSEPSAWSNAQKSLGVKAMTSLLMIPVESSVGVFVLVTQKKVTNKLKQWPLELSGKISLSSFFSWVK